MIEMEMSRDIQDFSPKVISFLNKRQVVCLLIGGAYSIPAFFAMDGLEITLKVTIMTILMTPAIACGWIKMYGMPLEKFFKKCIFPMFLSPRKRKYITKDTFGFEDPEKEKERLVTFKEIPQKKLKRKERKKREASYQKFNARK